MKHNPQPLAKLSKLDCAYLAGIIDARRLVPKHLGPRQRWIAQIRMSANRHGHGLGSLEKFAKLTRPNRYAQEHPAFGEAFYHAERPAIYKDGRALSTALEISSDKLEKLGRLVWPFLSRWSQAQFALFFEARHPAKTCEHCRRSFRVVMAQSQQRFCKPKCREAHYSERRKAKARARYKRASRKPA